MEGWQLTHLLFINSSLAEKTWVRTILPPEVWQSTQPVDAGWARDGSHISIGSWFLWQLRQKKGWLVVKWTRPRPGMAARIARTAAIRAQVPLESFGNAGIFMA
jgi:hypothetical protein